MPTGLFRKFLFLKSLETIIRSISLSFLKSPRAREPKNIIFSTLISPDSSFLNSFSFSIINSLSPMKSLSRIFQSNLLCHFEHNSLCHPDILWLCKAAQAHRRFQEFPAARQPSLPKLLNHELYRAV